MARQQLAIQNFEKHTGKTVPPFALQAMIVAPRLGPRVDLDEDIM
jgi:hypothetical protein